MPSFDHPARAIGVEPFRFGHGDAISASRDVAPLVPGCLLKAMNQFVTYRKLIAEHDSIEAAARVVVTIAEGAEAQAADATRALEALASLLRDHLTGEDPVIYETILAARGGRHADAARRVGSDLDRLKDDWESYLYRWDADHIAADWTHFADDTADMLGRIRERVSFETMVLYSLALHLDVIAAE